MHCSWNKVHSRVEPRCWDRLDAVCLTAACLFVRGSEAREVRGGAAGDELRVPSWTCLRRWYGSDGKSHGHASHRRFGLLMKVAMPVSKVQPKLPTAPSPFLSGRYAPIRISTLTTVAGRFCHCAFCSATIVIFTSGSNDVGASTAVESAGIDHAVSRLELQSIFARAKQTKIARCETRDVRHRSPDGATAGEPCRRSVCPTWLASTWMFAAAM